MENHFLPVFPGVLEEKGFFRKKTNPVSGAIESLWTGCRPLANPEKANTRCVRFNKTRVELILHMRRFGVFK